MGTSWPSVLVFPARCCFSNLSAYCVASAHWCASDPVVITHDSLSEIGAAEAENTDQMVLCHCRHVSHMQMAVKGDRKCREFPAYPFIEFKVESPSLFFHSKAETSYFQSVLLTPGKTKWGTQSKDNCGRYVVNPICHAIFFKQRKAIGNWFSSAAPCSITRLL